MCRRSCANSSHSLSPISGQSPSLLSPLAHGGEAQALSRSVSGLQGADVPLVLPVGGLLLPEPNEVQAPRGRQQSRVRSLLGGLPQVYACPLGVVGGWSW